jgi:acid stress chaperone HdeB
LDRGPTGFFQIKKPIVRIDPGVKEARLSVVISLLARASMFFVIFAAPAALAQVTVDVSKITCEQFNVLPKADSVAVWLSGYYHGGKRESVIDMNQFEENARNLRAACRQSDNFKRPIMQLIESNMPK